LTESNIIEGKLTAKNGSNCVDKKQQIFRVNTPLAAGCKSYREVSGPLQKLKVGDSVELDHHIFRRKLTTHSGRN